jgi:hypothetical protein
MWLTMSRGLEEVVLDTNFLKIAKIILYFFLQRFGFKKHYSNFFNKDYRIFQGLSKGMKGVL